MDNLTLRFLIREAVEEIYLQKLSKKPLTSNVKGKTLINKTKNKK
jgi:hypothetical protein